jgi:hypothetical protein
MDMATGSLLFAGGELCLRVGARATAGDRLAGDHSRSADDDMLKSNLGSRWVLGVAAISEELRIRLAGAGRPDQVWNALAART